MSERHAAWGWAWGMSMALAGAASGGCADAEQDDAAGGRAAAAVPPLIEESDLFKLVGSTLYVQNAGTGLSVIDVSEPALPVFRNRVRELAGNAGELYVRGASTFVLLEDVVPGCELPAELDSWAVTTQSEVVAVADAESASQAEIVSELCLPGTIVASRLVGEVLYVVTSLTGPGGAATWVFSVDTADPGAMAVVDHLAFAGEGYEVHVTDRTLYVAQRVGDGTRTRVRTVDFGAGDGAMTERGAFEVAGAVLSRFHLDEHEGTLRIVTFVSRAAGSNLHVVDVGDPDQPELVGSLTHLAPGEDLHATRFDGDVAYVVTYEPVVVQIDPLWVVSLADPTEPRILAELEVPGWSDFVFPRGDRLVAVGRGDRGERIASSLFDVSDLARPRQLARVEFGGSDATSEAGVDFRGVSIVDEELGEPALLAVPLSNNVWTGGRCTARHGVQLLDLGASDLELRGWIPQEGRVRRTLPVGGRLLTVTDQEVASVDVENRGAPTVTSSVTVGDPAAADPCVAPSPPAEDLVVAEGGFFCSAVPGGSARRAWAGPTALLLGLGILRRRHRRRATTTSR